MRKHVVLTLGRSGSNTLVNMLNQHPSILNYGEVIGDWNTVRKIRNKTNFLFQSEESYLDSLIYSKSIIQLINLARNISKYYKRDKNETKKIRQIDTVGFKEFSNHFKALSIDDYFKNRPDIKVIGLHRNSVIDRFISYKLLDQTGIVSVSLKDNDKKIQSLHLNPDSLYDDLLTIENENIHLKRILETIPAENVLNIEYEDFFHSNQRTAAIMGDVYEFLQVDKLSPVIRMKKIIPGKSFERIANLSECRDVLSGTHFERCLYD